MTAWPALLKRQTLARYLDISTTTLDKEVAAGRLPEPVMFGGNKHWRKSDVDRMIDGTARTIDEARRQFEENLERVRNKAA